MAIADDILNGGSPTPEPAAKSGFDFNGVSYASESDRNQAAAAFGAGNAANAASTSASITGAKTESANAVVADKVSKEAAIPAAVKPNMVVGTKPEMKTDTSSTITGDVEFKPPATSVTNDASVTETKPKKAEKSEKTKALEVKTEDMLSDGLDFIKNMAEGGDPTIQASFNSWLNKFATSNASSRAALMMNLRSQPGYTAGSGEGTAALLMMARGTNTTLADMVSKMSIANVQFMMDANKLGIEKAIEVKRFINENETHDLQTQISDLQIQQGELNLDVTRQNMESTDLNQEVVRQNLQQAELDQLKDYGQYDKIAEILNKKYPGLNVNSATIRSADPATLNAMSGQKAAINALVESGDAIAAKAQAVAYYGQFWQNEGFRSQEEAIAFANKLDFSAAAFEVRTKNIDTASTAVRKYAVAVPKDSSAGKAAVVDYYKATGRDPADIGAVLTVDQVNEMRKYFDPKSETETSLTGEDKRQLGIDWEWYQQNKSAAGANTVGAVYDSFASAAKNAGAPFDADQERMVKAWINTKLTYGDIAANTSAPNGYNITNKTTLLPWDDPATSFYYTTWPKYDFSGAEPEMMDAGGQRYSSINGGNYGANTAAEDKRLDDAYLAYLHNPKRDATLTREQWYMGSKGGTVDLVKNPIATPTLTTPVEKAKDFSDFLATSVPANGSATKIPDLDSWANEIKNAYAAKPDTGQFTLDLGNGSDWDEAGRRLKAKGLLNESIVRTDDTGGDKTYYGTKEFVNYAIYVKFLRSGMDEATARTALEKLVGQNAADIALRADGIPDKTTASTSGTTSVTGSGYGQNGGIMGSLKEIL